MNFFVVLVALMGAGLGYLAVSMLIGKPKPPEAESDADEQG
ncbi:hypothetical protein BH10PSE17_BH10PSE17_13830 [soil metagenome]